MFKELQSKKNSKQIILNEKEYKIVEHKLQLAQEPNMTEIRKWFIFKAEKIYSTKMLGTQVIYCNKTLNKIKEKYQFNNLALAAKLDVWLIKYKQLGYDGIFDFLNLIPTGYCITLMLIFLIIKVSILLIKIIM